MELINKDSYELSTGKVIHPNRGIIGLTEAEEGLRIYEGYDGNWIVESEIEGSAYTKDNIELTNEEVREIAIYMSKLWQRLADGETCTIKTLEALSLELIKKRNDLYSDMNPKTEAEKHGYIMDNSPLQQSFNNGKLATYDEIIKLWKQ